MNQKKNGSLYKDVISIFIGIFLFLSGFIFNIVANIIYDRYVKNSDSWALFFISISIICTVFIIFLIKRYILDRLEFHRKNFKK